VARKATYSAQRFWSQSPDGLADEQAGVEDEAQGDEQQPSL